MNIENKKIHYTGDVGDKNDLLLFSEFKPDLLISEITHVQLIEILDAFGEDHLPEQIIFTHISDDDEDKLVRFFHDLPVELREKFITAEDGLNITI